MQPISTTEPLGRMAARSRAALRTLLDRDIDFFCHGNRTLQQACDQLELDPEAVADEIRARQKDNGSDSTSWDELPLGRLIDVIIERFHRPLQDELPRLVVQAEETRRARSREASERYDRLQTEIQELSGELDMHLAKEENILFPWIRQGNGRTAGDPIRVMQLEHESAATALRHIRTVTDGFALPESADPQARALYESLRKLDRDLREHIHLENNILFPRALSE